MSKPIRSGLQEVPAINTYITGSQRGEGDCSRLTLTAETSTSTFIWLPLSVGRSSYNLRFVDVSFVKIYFKSNTLKFYEIPIKCQTKIRWDLVRLPNVVISEIYCVHLNLVLFSYAGVKIEQRIWLALVWKYFVCKSFFFNFMFSFRSHRNF